jgi:hypothetical protein
MLQVESILFNVLHVGSLDCFRDFSQSRNVKFYEV